MAADLAHYRPYTFGGAEVNRNIIIAVLIVAALAALAWVASQEGSHCPDGTCPVKDVEHRPRPWGGDGKALVGGPVHPDGTEVLIDLPSRFHVKNKGGSDGAGLCVYASARHSGLWHDEPVFQGLFEWMRSYPGGSYPEKFDRSVEQFCQQKSLPKPAYLNTVTGDLALLRKACQAGYFPGVTYAFSPTGRYGGRISHMVSLVHLDDRWAAILDNNFPGSIEWMPVADFKRSWTGGGESGWALIPLRPGPPPVPHN